MPEAVRTDGVDQATILQDNWADIRFHKLTIDPLNPPETLLRGLYRNIISKGSASDI
jgi:hypothetical protein